MGNGVGKMKILSPTLSQKNSLPREREREKEREKRKLRYLKMKMVPSKPFRNDDDGYDYNGESSVFK